MTNGSVAYQRLALDDLGEHVDVIFGKENANALADGNGVSTDGDEKPLVADTNPDVASETQDAFRV
jgi:hypothetical protein